jgi:hypothetical protein
LTVDIYRSREQAEEERAAAVADDPDWVVLLSVVRLDLPEPHPN